ncbi:uncharacterized protein LOC134235518 isoform X2 [Saccostrea cucullata]|uniref:uncharacterized protein LOC134235518 isoform X2 n=1 Tax=Saccostrea cuccullata TaxID=36930 RepID=UPI002ED6AFEC
MNCLWNNFTHACTSFTATLKKFMKCCRKEDMSKDRNLRGQQIGQRHAELIDFNKQHLKQEKYQNSTRAGVHTLVKRSVADPHHGGNGKQTESVDIKDLNQPGSLKNGKQNQRYSTVLPNISKNVSYPEYAASALSRWDQKHSLNTRHQHITAKQSVEDLGTKVWNQPTNRKDRICYEDKIKIKATIHTYGTSSSHKEKISSFSNNLHEKSMPRREFSPKYNIHENDQVYGIYSTGESTVERRQPPKGLPNIGNTCYANSLLQVLGQTPFLYETLISSTTDHALNRVDNQMKTTVTYAFRNLLRSMNSVTFDPISGTIAELMNKVSCREHEFRIGFQNDCLSFFLALLSEIHDENQAKETTRIFEIEMVDEFSFDSCAHKEITGTQIIRCLNIPSNSHDVEGGLETLLNEEEFDEADVPCRECEADCTTCRKGKTRKAMRFCTLPKVLVIQLGCFQEKSYGGHIHIAKSMRRTCFSEKLRVPKSNGSIVNYHLYGVVNHHGSVYGGHYTSFVKHFTHHTGHWYNCNDKHVRYSTLSEALDSRDAYLLFYKM